MTFADPAATFERSRIRWIAVCTVILLIGAAFRLVALQDVPPGLAQDEVLNADIVGFIRGGENAFFFRYGYGHEPLYHYWSVPFQVLLGDNFLSIRLPAVVLGMLLIALTMRWARRDFGRTVAWVAGFGLAASWWAVIFSRIGLRPIMEPVMLVMAVLLWPRGGGRWALVRIPLTGAILGLSLYTYTAARVLFALPAGYALYCGIMSLVSARRWRGGGNLVASTPDYRRQAGWALLALAVMATVSLPLFLTLRADPSLQQRVDQLSGPLDALAQGQWRPILSTTVATLGAFGATGDPRWTYGPPNLPLFEPLAALLFMGGLVVALRQWRRPAMVFALLWLIVALIPSAVTPDAPSSVRLVGAMPVVYLLPGLAIAAMWHQWPSRSSRAVRGAAGATLVLIALLAAGRTVRAGFIDWPKALDTRLKYQTVLLDISRDERLQTNHGSVQSTPVLVDGFFEPIDNSSLDRDLGRHASARWVQSGAGNSGALVWPGARSESSPIFVPEFAPLSEDLLAQAGASQSPVFRSAERPSYAMYTLPPAPALSEQPVTFFVDGVPVLALHTVSRTQPGDEATLYTLWQVLAPLPADLAIFLHVSDDTGEVAAQFDGLDAAAQTLYPDDVILQRHVITPPPDTAAGPLALQLGLYRRSDGSRLQTADKRDVIDVGQCSVNAGESGQVELTCDLLEEW
jgi:4-amino-4-deoxy-L-arabinose transferase-like glycosyltransferase